jgi:hypothetical protein
LAAAIVPYSKLRIDVQGVVLPGPTRFGRSTRILLTLGIAAAVTAKLFLFSPAAFAQLGAQTAPANLDDLTQLAATILRGSVVSVAIEPHPQFSNIQTVTVTISVARVLKGESSKIFTFRQFVWDPREAAAAAGYRKGGELLLFLNPNSEYGLTSPVGLDQGRFRVLRDASGKAFAVNGRANFALFNQVLGKASSRGLHFSRQAAVMMTAPHGKVPLESFEDAVITLARAGK